MKRVFKIIITLYFVVSVIMCCYGAVKGKILRNKAESSYQISNDINDPINYEFVREVAFNLDIPFEEVTQQQFDDRYNN